MSLVSEFARRRALSSMAHLFDHAERQPLDAALILTEAAHDERPYPDSYAAIFLLGLILGICSCAAMDWRDVLANIKFAHQNHMHWKPMDYIGKRRKWAR